MKCSYCGCEIVDGIKYCQKCGAPVDKYNEKEVYTGEVVDESSGTGADDISDSVRTIGIVAYITWIGLIIAFVSSEKDHPFVKHHLNQAIVLDVIGAVCTFVPLIGWIGSIVCLVLTIMGIVSACKREMTPLPIIGNIKFIN